MWLLQAENVIVNMWPDSGPPRQEDGLRNHVDLVQMLDIVDMDAGTTVAGESLRSDCLGCVHISSSIGIL